MLLLLFARPKAALCVDEILIYAAINGQPVRLELDTGAGGSLLLRKTVDRLGLKTTGMRLTDECTLTIQNQSQPATFRVVEDPYPFPITIDGVIGWPAVSNRVFELDVERNLCRISDTVPSQLRGWTTWTLVRRSPIVVIERSRPKEFVRIGLDTGFNGGVMLSPELWYNWRRARAHSPSTVNGYVQPDGTFNTNEVLRARKLTIGPLRLRDQPVLSADDMMFEGFLHSDAVLGRF